MGFDMNMVRDPELLPKGYTPLDDRKPGHFRYNLREMLVTIGAMERADCVHDGSPPPWPEPPEDISPDRLMLLRWSIESEDDSMLEGIPVPVTEAERAECERHIAACQVILDASSVEEGRVGAYKFQDNNGWLVTEQECEIIARAVRDKAAMIASQMFTDAGFAEREGLAWLEQWASFNAVAAEHGGYRVT